MTIKNKVTRKTLKTLEKISGHKLTFGRLLSSIRQGEEESQISFAGKLEISKQYLCDLERGRRFPSVGAAAEYARKLGYAESQFVRLCLQDMVDKEGLGLEVSISALAVA